MNKGAEVWTQQGEVRDFSALSLDGPLLLLNVDASMQVASPGEDISAPLVCVRETTSVDQALQEANVYLSGLGASVWSKDLRKAKAIARRLKVGLVWINDSSVGLPQFPWGGTNQSGWGRLFSELALTELTCLKVISAERQRGASRKFWWFPYSKEKHETFLALNALLYGQRNAKKIFSLIISFGKNFLRARRG